MKLLDRSALLVSLSLVSLGLAGCRAVSRPFTGPEARVEGVAQLDLEESIPQADPAVVALGELQLRVDADLLDEAACADLGRGMAQVAGGLTSWKTREKRPEYRVVVRQVNSQDEWKASPVGGGLGALVGGGAGLAMSDGDLSRGALSAIGGGAGGALLFSENLDTWMFSVAVYRRTTKDAVKKRLEDLESKGLQFGARVEDATISVATSKDASTRSTEFNFDADEYPTYVSFAVVVDSGSFTSKDACRAAAKKALVERLPRLIFGGDEITF
jgi:hypothetical protein